MADPIDAYADQFQLATGPYGATLSFQVSPPTPPAPGAAVNPERIATIRTSLEHLKVMAFILYRQILEHERQSGTTIPIPSNVLNDLRVGPEDWEAYWRGR